MKAQPPHYSPAPKVKPRITHQAFCNRHRLGIFLSLQGLLLQFALLMPGARSETSLCFGIIHNTGAKEKGALRPLDHRSLRSQKLYRTVAP